MSTAIAFTDQTKRAALKLRRTIDLDIAGADLVLRGRFSHWESGLGFGPDLDRVNVRLAVDATSNQAPAAAADGADRAPALFAFSSRSVESGGPGAFRAHGTFTGPEGSRPLDVVLETPMDHTALIVLSFGADRQDFGEGFADLIDNVLPFADHRDGQPVRSAHAWLTAPVLAAA